MTFFELSELNCTPAQSPGWGDPPPLLVSPPWESSLSEVKTIGAAAVPCALSVPSTTSDGLPDLMICPAPIVSVTPAATSRLPASVYTTSGLFHVALWERVPPFTTTPLLPLPTKLAAVSPVTTRSAPALVPIAGLAL